MSGWITVAGLGPGSEAMVTPEVAAISAAPGVDQASTTGMR